eukprot:scaffold4849_cov131-Isochrysis_galbana.AAC.3
MLVPRERDSDRSILPSLLRLPAGCRVGILTSLRHAILNRLHPSPSALIQCVGPGFVRFRVASVACAWLYARYSSIYACRAPMCTIYGMRRARMRARLPAYEIYDIWHHRAKKRICTFAEFARRNRSVLSVASVGMPRAAPSAERLPSQRADAVVRELEASNAELQRQVAQLQGDLKKALARRTCSDTKRREAEAAQRETEEKKKKRKPLHECACRIEGCTRSE